MDDFIVVLGHENDAEGNLSNCSESRCILAAELLREAKQPTKVILTGGFGLSFNLSNASHSSLLRRYLVQLGVDERQIVHEVRSAGTHQDAIGVLSFLKEHNEIGHLKVVTSDYHAERAELIFRYFLSTINLEFAVAKSDRFELERIKEGEKATEFRKLRTNIPAGLLAEKEDLERLSGELRHYDNLSYLALSALFALGILVNRGISNAVEKKLNTDLLVWEFLIAFVASLFIFNVYLRLANTASIFRRLISDFAFFLKKPDISMGVDVRKRTFQIVPSVAIIAILIWVANLLQVVGQL